MLWGTALWHALFSSSKAQGTPLEMLASLMLSRVKGRAIRLTLIPHKNRWVVRFLTIKGEETGLSE